LERVQEVGDFGMIWPGLHAAQSDEALNDLTQILRGLVVARLGVNEAFNTAADHALD
jgi:SpoU rRNA methylase family enzyme